MKKMKINWINIVVVISISVIVIATIGISCLLELGNTQTYVIESVAVQMEIHDNNTKYSYLCVTDKGESLVFKNEDSLLNGKFDSQSILSKIKKHEKNNQPFKVTTKGYRFGLLSMYPNIIKIEESDNNE